MRAGAFAILASLTTAVSMALAQDPAPRLAPAVPAAPPAVSPTVIVLKHSPPNEAATEAAARVEGELGAAGFRVVDVSLADDVRSAIESAGLGGDGPPPIAAFAIVVQPPEPGDAPVAEIWVSDRVRQRTVIQRMSLDGAALPRGAEILAVRAVELLKASLAEYWLPSRPAPAPPPAPAASAVVAVPPPTPPTAERRSAGDAALGAVLGVEVGAGVIASSGGPSPMWTPVVKVLHGLGPGVAVGVDLRGLGPSAQLANADGSARVDMQVAAVDVMASPWPRGVVVPFGCIEGGAEHLRVTGTGAPQFSGATRDTWSAWTAAGAGATIPITRWMQGSAGVLASLAWPPTGVRIAGDEMGRVGGPSLVVDAGLVGTFR